MEKRTAKQQLARQTGIPRTQAELERKLGRGIMRAAFSMFKSKK